ncbi:unnamed protein product [Plutella xylostella]|uniref:(diamondback moth) hypothetical protein n=1 Tax=Plutella xylostella TaxID=51655 RepID=A0A8S4D8H7_PLUXY|nr:unnamed protein product [Plutella xylostella]
MKLKIIILLVFSVVAQSLGQQKRCYACSFSNTDTDTSCLYITEKTNRVECNSKYCTIYRQEFVDPSGRVSSFLRGCEETPDFLNHDIVDPTYRTYYRACTNDLCNIGDGIQSITGGQLSPVPEYNGVNLLVPGTGKASAATHIQLSSFFVFIAIIFNFIMA